MCLKELFPTRAKMLLRNMKTKKLRKGERKGS